jgi:hypothetical protein
MNLFLKTNKNKINFFYAKKSIVNAANKTSLDKLQKKYDLFLKQQKYNERHKVYSAKIFINKLYTPKINRLLTKKLVYKDQNFLAKERSNKFLMYDKGTHIIFSKKFKKRLLSQNILSRYVLIKNLLNKAVLGKDDLAKFTLSKHTLSKHTLNKHTLNKHKNVIFRNFLQNQKFRFLTNKFYKNFYNYLFANSSFRISDLKIFVPFQLYRSQGNHPNLIKILKQKIKFFYSKKIKLKTKFKQFKNARFRRLSFRKFSFFKNKYKIKNFFLPYANTNLEKSTLSTIFFKNYLQKNLLLMKKNIIRDKKYRFSYKKKNYKSVFTLRFLKSSRLFRFFKKNSFSTLRVNSCDVYRFEELDDLDFEIDQELYSLFYLFEKAYRFEFFKNFTFMQCSHGLLFYFGFFFFYSYNYVKNNSNAVEFSNFTSITDRFLNFFFKKSYLNICFDKDKKHFLQFLPVDTVLPEELLFVEEKKIDYFFNFFFFMPNCFDFLKKNFYFCDYRKYVSFFDYLKIAFLKKKLTILDIDERITDEFTIFSFLKNKVYLYNKKKNINKLNFFFFLKNKMQVYESCSFFDGFSYEIFLSNFFSNRTEPKKNYKTLLFKNFFNDFYLNKKTQSFFITKETMLRKKKQNVFSRNTFLVENNNNLFVQKFNVFSLFLQDLFFFFSKPLFFKTFTFKKFKLFKNFSHASSIFTLFRNVKSVTNLFFDNTEKLVSFNITRKLLNALSSRKLETYFFYLPYITLISFLEYCTNQKVCIKINPFVLKNISSVDTLRCLF